ncbi:hypothetical protein QYS48_33665 [Marivirga arenosa]|uniref:Uncharacterized protein n=1 Tax=Marivirga arenosa TaxID=3059076 RepID=A0AA51RD83_9BACT|nr:hypothetical protein [Marivirga sp. ABR2-2]WMN06770.1 hypothetical protein QYS48_33665 [Marivirga sp. ABR2-2]
MPDSSWSDDSQTFGADLNADSYGQTTVRPKVISVRPSVLTRLIHI